MATAAASSAAALAAGAGSSPTNTVSSAALGAAGNSGPASGAPGDAPSKAVALASYVGFDTITHQIERKLLRRGFAFNIMLVGATGLGKSTLLNSIFSSHLVDSKHRLRPNDAHRQTTEITLVTHVLEENNVRLKLTVVDTPGYGDLLNNEHCMDPILKYIRDQYAAYLRKELTASRDRNIPDTRIHCALFLISPTGHSLKPLDIVTMRQLSEICNVVPVIAKADALTMEERAVFKQRIREEIEYHGIRMCPRDLGPDHGPPTDEDDAKDRVLLASLRAMLPFAIIGSETTITVDGKSVRGRRTRAGGMIMIENEKHCDFVHLRNFLTRTHLQDLIESTGLHYESFRTRQLLALKENREAANVGAAIAAGNASSTSSTANIQRQPSAV